ncbi:MULTISPECIES: PRC-barrel domain-containing protein [Geobacillus]|uniref:Photosystem reaction center subunit H n=1 Tax=Geobacillus thermocatenulatus TaxID=33938 RepID=A0A226QCN3_9BACL|nr:MULTISPECIES: PRC-barrel domain-containing protein [Geobacillus]KPD01581.1 PRC-barrel domain protein [Geobacillus sp. BCO2]RAN22570.1 photosystem reaction center subunit H [Geobacillus sp. A8]ASS98684.1 photosystem reaction center subunit H [Geobacillus thermocatenulatus]KLR73941.1 photosystem reaction center subunit H [Geobacillus sp. T6]OXB89437.1 photosystem reaction center subunit H [Geobacillus thermocatenulatus]
MKTSAQIMGLPIISIADGAQIGAVKSFVINPDKGSIDFFTIEQEDVQLSLKAIPFKKVIGIGEFAVTVANVHDVIDLAEIPIANQLVNKQIRIKNTKAITRKGQLLGEVYEFFLNEETGDIVGIALRLENGEAVLPADQVLTYGKDIVIVSDDAKDALVADASMLTQQQKIETESDGISDHIHHAAETAENIEALESLREKQVALLAGKRVVKDIYDLKGELLFPAGTTLREEDVRRAQEAGPSVIVDVSMNVEAE